MFEPYTQQDAQECLHCILDACGSAAETAVKEIEKVGLQIFSSAFVYTPRSIH